MMTTIELYLPYTGRGLICRALPSLALGITFLVGSPSTNATPTPVSAEALESGNAQDAQSQGNYIDEAEEKAYRAIRKETDATKRAALLFAFYQKYPNSLLLEPDDFKIIRPLEEEYGAYYAASQEPDLDKRATMYIDFLQKYPASAFKPNVENEYSQILRKAAQEKKFDLLESMAVKWQKVKPNDRETLAYLADAAINLQKFEKGAEYLEALYALQPSPNLAKEIFATYQKTQNSAKQIEWAERLFAMPEFEKDYMLRFNSVSAYISRNDFAKAAEFAQLTLKSADLIQQPDAAAQEQLKKVRRACHHVIGTNLMEKGNFAEAINAFKQALKVEKYGEGFYKIGQCYENLKDIENAMLYYARTSLLGGDFADKAKTRLELLYKALHNDTLIGIDKVYKKAQEPEAN